MQLQTGEIRHPHERGGVARHDFLGGASRREVQRDDVEPFRPRRRSAFLIEEVGVHAVRVTHEHVRPSAGAAQSAVGYGEVVPREVELRMTGLRKQDFGGIRERHLEPVHGEERAIAHGPYCANGARGLRPAAGSRPGTCTRPPLRHRPGRGTPACGRGNGRPDFPSSPARRCAPSRRNRRRVCP